LLAISTLSLAVFGGNLVVTNCFALTVALVAGTFLSRQVGSVGALSMMLIVAAVVDLLSVHLDRLDGWSSRPNTLPACRLIQFLAISLHMDGRLVPVIGPPS
jgi:hypothetical protein